MTTEQKNFIENIAKYVQKYASSYAIKVHSPIIAQAILESGWGKSTLSAKYHNYFGLKCGGSWKGKSVNMNTMEEYTAGTYTKITANFRVYDSMEEGVKGYFDFINYSRYANLKGVTDPKKYLELIRADGYATSSTYVTNTYRLVTQYNLTQYDPGQSTTETTTPTKSLEEIVAEVIAGKWGNYPERKTKLEAAGYDYRTVQNAVNEKLKSTTTTQTKTITAGMELKLTKCALYATSVTKTKANTLTGTYYLWSDKATKGRYKITNAKSRVGVAGQVTGWIDEAYVK